MPIGGLEVNRSRVSATRRLCFKGWIQMEVAPLRAEIRSDLLYVCLFCL